MKNIDELLSLKTISLDDLLTLPDENAFRELVVGNKVYAVIPHTNSKTGQEIYYLFEHLKNTEFFVKITQYQTGIRYIK